MSKSMKKQETADNVVRDEILYLRVASIDPDPEQPRLEVDAELADSIKQHGVLQAIQVRPHPVHADRWMIVDGERRWKGAKAAKCDTIPATIGLDVEDVGDRIIRQIVRNEGKPLTPVEEALAFKKIIDHRHADGDKRFGVVQLAKQLGIAKSTVSDRLTLTEIPAFWLELIVKGPLQPSHAPILHRWRKVPEKFQRRALEQMQSDYRWPGVQPGHKAKGGDRLYVGDFERLMRTFFPEFVKPVSDVPGYDGPTERFTIETYTGAKTYAMDPSKWQPIYRKAIAAKRAKSAKGGATGSSTANEEKWREQQRKQQEKDARQRKRWETAAPAIFDECAKLVGKASIAQLQRLVTADLHRHTPLTKKAGALIPPAATADSIVRSIALYELAAALSHTWDDGRDFRAKVKGLNLDVDKLLKAEGDSAAEEETEEQDELEAAGV